MGEIAFYIHNDVVSIEADIEIEHEETSEKKGEEKTVEQYHLVLFIKVPSSTLKGQSKPFCLNWAAPAIDLLTPPPEYC